MRRTKASTQIFLYSLVFIATLVFVFAATAAEPASRTTRTNTPRRVLLAEKLSKAQNDQEWLELYIVHTADRAPHYPPNKRVKKLAPETAAIIRAYARGYAIPYQVAAVVARSESTFHRDAQGKQDKADWGLFQVNRRIHHERIRDLDLATTEGQVEAGMRVLELGYRICKNWRGSMAFYSTGSCKVPPTHRKYRNVNHRYMLLVRAGYPIDRM